MATASVTIELDLPDGVEIREYQRHGDGHAFHVAWPPPDRCRCDGCTQEGPTRLDCKATFYVVRDLDLWGQPSFWVYQPPLHHCPHCGRRQHLLPPFAAATSPTHTASSGTSWPVSLAALRRRWRNAWASPPKPSP